ncbi:Flagellar motor switch protein FliM [Candidatus Hydrogenisulfobacillus filiaventi]|uniref:Flagellar motor switch protein FliM n=1 Tax=Candidatus Hydrogenisulfobacillus filiaventi TaxID=2707344 RepID=A0A6F8ZE29_9FIRM|nr:FliM/FliN family flagellar motor C-terminal domain-containing protein [Bacillota bacterium]CAB1127944.1 Flagellar motor switch protein FliM [Candidatus Hydrogenisulfobacillus filiaventi]
MADEQGGALSQSEIDALIAALRQEEAGPAAPAPAEPETEAMAPAPPEPAAASGPVAGEPPAGTGAPPAPVRELDPKLARIADLDVTLSVLLGHRVFTLRELLGWGIGTRITLEEGWREPVYLAVNGRLVGRGRVVLVGNRFGVRVERWGT